MPQDDQELVRAGYAAFARGDFDAVRELIAEDLVITDDTLPEAPDQGREGLFTNVARIRDAFDELHYEPVRMLQEEDRVLALVLVRARGHGSGAFSEGHICQLWTMRDGIARRMDTYLDWERGLAALRTGPDRVAETPAAGPPGPGARTPPP